MVLFDSATYEKLHKEIVSVKLITSSVVSELLKVRASLARAGLRELHDKRLMQTLSWCIPCYQSRGSLEVSGTQFFN